MLLAGEFVTLEPNDNERARSSVLVDGASLSGSCRALKLHVRRAPNPNPTLVMLHGLSDSGACWQRVAARLSSQFDLIAVDLRGHGLSDAPETGYAVSDFVQDVVGVLDALGCLRVTLIGHSLGADAAVHVATLRPDLVESLVLEDPPWNDAWLLGTVEEREQRSAQWARDLRALQCLDRDRIIGIGKRDNPGWDIQELEPWAESKQQFRLQALEYVRAERPAWQLVVRGLSCRALLVSGETRYGGLVSEAMAEEARQLVADLEVLKLDGAGHCVHRDRFEGYIAGVMEFLARG